jgi:cytochrome-b5 reductase
MRAGLPGWTARFLPKRVSGALLPRDPEAGTMTHQATLLMSGFVTHDTRRLVLSRPEGLAFEPGQGVELAIDDPKWRDQGRPFTPTSLAEDRVLELTIKRYPQRDGVTTALHGLAPGTAVTLSDPFGTIAYRGPGVFIAAGTGITPFLAILRRLAADDALAGHSLFFSNKSEQDVICGPELEHYLGERCLFTFTREHQPGHAAKHIDAGFLAGHVQDLDQYFYVCGPEGFVEAVNRNLLTIGADPDRLVYER